MLKPYENIWLLLVIESAKITLIKSRKKHHLFTLIGVNVNAQIFFEILINLF